MFQTDSRDWTGTLGSAWRGVADPCVSQVAASRGVVTTLSLPRAAAGRPLPPTPAGAPCHTAASPFASKTNSKRALFFCAHG